MDSYEPKRPKAGGRKKGTPNKALSTIAYSLSLRDFHYIEEFIKLYRDPDTPNLAKMRMLEALLPYITPKLKEVSVEEKPVKELTDQQLIELVPKENE